MKDGKHALALRDEVVTLLEVDTGKVLGSLVEENEQVITFALSPNQQVLVTATKSYMVKTYRMPQEMPAADDQEATWKPELFQNFRLVGCLALELCVDPSSRFVAIGTSDSQIKIYDLQKGFQTHNFTGHRGVIVKMQFVP